MSLIIVPFDTSTVSFELGGHTYAFTWQRLGRKAYGGILEDMAADSFNPVELLAYIKKWSLPAPNGQDLPLTEEVLNALLDNRDLEQGFYQSFHKAQEPVEAELSKNDCKLADTGLAAIPRVAN